MEELGCLALEKSVRCGAAPAGSAAYVGCADESVGVCAPSPPLPQRRTFYLHVYLTEAADHFYSLCFQMYLSSSAQTHKSPETRTRARFTDRPPTALKS